jgi:hypothetical protein
MANNRYIRNQAFPPTRKTYPLYPPIRESFATLTLGGLALDEVTMDPAQIQSPLEMKDSR